MMRWAWSGALAVVLAAPAVLWAQPGGPGRGGPACDGPECGGMMPGAMGEEDFDEELPPQERKALLREFQENNPEGFERLQQLRKSRPDAFRRKVRGLRPLLKDPKAREMMRKNWKSEAKLRKLIQAFKQTEDAGEKDKLKGEIRAGLNEQFDAKLKGHEMHLAQMEKRIVEMKERIAKRRSAKKKIVEKRLGEITGDEESWDW